MVLCGGQIDVRADMFVVQAWVSCFGSNSSSGTDADRFFEAQEMLEHSDGTDM